MFDIGNLLDINKLTIETVFLYFLKKIYRKQHERRRILISFKNLNLTEPLMQAITKEGYVSPTPIQKQAIPPLLEGKDLLGIAQTGTGKTAAFVLPILQLMSKKTVVVTRGTPRTLILAPTRELAAQIDQSIVAYGRFLKFRHTVVFGGVNQYHQVKALQAGVDILVATPGRLLDLINQRHIYLKNIEFFVLDEADRMLDMGFIHDVRRIISLLPVKRQSLFFSATMSDEVSNLADRLLTNPVRVEVTPQATTVEKVEQKVFFVQQSEKNRLLLWLLKQQHLTCVLVFTKTKHRANKVAAMLLENGVKSDAIHGNKSQPARTLAMNNFRAGHSRVLVATDIAARGIDIDNISHVINYDLPNEPENYVHRIGRTARAGAAGTAYSFCSHDERPYLKDIQKLTKVTIGVLEHGFHPEKPKSPSDQAPPPESRHKEHTPKDFAPREHAPREHAPREHAPREHAPREHAPREHAPREHAKKDSNPREYSSKDPEQKKRDFWRSRRKHR